MVIWDRDAVVNREPISELRKLSRQFNSLFNSARLSGLDVFPPVNIWSGSEKAVVTAELPGVKKQDLDILVENDVLTINGHREPQQVREGENVIRAERGYGSFRRVIALPFSVEGDAVSAGYKDGILRLELPRHETSKPKQIKIM